MKWGWRGGITFCKGVVLGDLEALEGIAGGPRLHLVIELNEGDVVPARYQPHLLKTREPGGRKGGGTGGQVSTGPP